MSFDSITTLSFHASGFRNAAEHTGMRMSRDLYCARDHLANLSAAALHLTRNNTNFRTVSPDGRECFLVDCAALEALAIELAKGAA